jgi:hypothetical protein
LDFLDHVVDEAFLEPVHRGMILVEEKPDALLEAIRRYAVNLRRLSTISSKKLPRRQEHDFTFKNAVTEKRRRQNK